MLSLRLLALAAISLVLTACSRAGADQQDQQARMAASWTSTAVLVLDGWLSSAVPNHYARRTSQTVSKQLSDLTDEQQGEPDAAVRQRQMQQATETLRRAERGIEASDRAAVQNSRNELAAAAANFRKQARHGQ